MKKKMITKISTSLLSFGLLVAALSGCSTNVGGNEIGDYYFYSNGQEYNIVLSNEGKANFSIDGKELTGTYSINGNKIVIQLSDNTTIEATYENGVLHFNYDDIDMIFVRNIDYKVSFVTNDGSSIDPITVKNGSKLTKPKDPIKKQHKFVGWFKDSAFKTPFDFNKEIITQDITLYAKWEYIEKTFKLTYKTSDGMELEKTFGIVTEGQPYKLEVPAFTNGATFVGWATEDGVRLTDEKGESLSKWEGTEDITIVAWTNSDSFLKLDNGTYRAQGIGYAADTTEITIPAYHNGEKVTEIGSFAGIDALEVLNIPATVEYVDINIFENLKHIKEVNVISHEDVENPVYTSKDGVLYCDEGKTLSIYPLGKEDTEFVVPASVTEIGEYAFADFTEMDDETYENFSIGKLTKVVLPRNLTHIRDYAFTHRGNLKTVEFVEGGTQPLVFGKGAFISTPLENFVFPENLVEIGDRAFESDPLCQNLKFATEKIVIPNSVKRIGNKAFFYISEIVDYDSYPYVYSGLNEVKIGPNVEYLGNQAFGACMNLHKVDMDPNIKIKALNEGVFSSAAMSEFTIPASVEIIGSNAFDGSSIESLTIPETVTTIHDYGLAGMKKIEEITIPASVTSFGGNVFKDCRNLEFDSITLKNDLIKQDGAIFNAEKTTILFFNSEITDYVMPDTVTHIPNALFADTDLETIKLSANLKEISDEAFNDSCLTAITIPASVERIGSESLGVYDLKSITFEEGSKLKSIGDSAFMNCSITSIELPDGLEEIGSEVFTFIKGIKNLVIPDSVKTIGDNCFRQMTKTDYDVYPAVVVGGLESITLPKSLTTLGKQVFKDSSFLSTIKISDEAANFKVVENILYTKDNEKLIKYCSLEDRKTYKVLDGTKIIEAGAFGDVKGIDKVELPATVSELGNNAFSKCDVKELDLSNVTILGDYCLSTTQLTKVSFNKNLKVLPKGILSTSKITEIDLSNIEVVGEQAFNNCADLKKVIFGDKPTVFEKNSFSNSGIEELVIPEYMTHINASLFDGLKKLNKLVIHEGVTEIDAYAFRFNFQCVELEELVLHEAITSIGEKAFESNKIKNIIIDSQAAVDAIESANIVFVNYKGETFTDKVRIKEGLTVNKETEAFLTKNNFVKSESVVDGYVEYVHETPAP